MNGNVDVILLAGDRGPGDPLALHAGVGGKTLVPVAGRAMLSRVSATLLGWPGLGRLILVAPPTEAYRQAMAETEQVLGRRLCWVEPRTSLFHSIEAALELEPTQPCLLLTADHVLLDPDWLDVLLARPPEEGLALALALSDWHTVMERFPGSRRTRYRFRDCSLCGTNLFALYEADGVRRILKLWRSVERERKKPWRIVSLLGWGNLGRYLAGRLDSAEAFALLSRRLGAGVRPLLLDDPLAAVDVDSPADLALVEQVLAERGGRPC